MTASLPPDANHHEADWDALRALMGKQPLEAPPPQVREQLLQHVKTMRPALFSPPPDLKAWGSLLALWVFVFMTWLIAPGPALSWECEHLDIVQFVVYRQSGADWVEVAVIPALPGGEEYTLTDAYYFPLSLQVVYSVVALDVNGMVLDRATTTLSAWSLWFNYVALILFSASFALFVVNWLHWRDLRRLGA